MITGTSYLVNPCAIVSQVQLPSSAGVSRIGVVLDQLNRHDLTDEEWDACGCFCRAIRREVAGGPITGR
jgi:hypothetical protein